MRQRACYKRAGARKGCAPNFTPTESVSLSGAAAGAGSATHTPRDRPAAHQNAKLEWQLVLRLGRVLRLGSLSRCYGSEGAGHGRDPKARSAGWSASTLRPTCISASLRRFVPLFFVLRLELRDMMLAVPAAA